MVQDLVKILQQISTLVQSRSSQGKIGIYLEATPNSTPLIPTQLSRMFYLYKNMQTVYHTD